MTEADVYSLIGALAGGQVYPDVAPLSDTGSPAISPPWITFTLVSQVYGDTLGALAEETTALQVDVYATTVDEARELRDAVQAELVPLQFTQLTKTGGYESDTGLRRATLEIAVQQ